MPFALTFLTGFAGPKYVYGYAQSYSGNNGGWQLLGSWTSSPTLSALSVTPNSGSGLGQQIFTAVFADPNGASDIQAVYLIVGGSTPPYVSSSCFVAYVPYGNALYLFNDSGTGLATGSPITAGASETLSNSQCTLSGSGGLPTLMGDTLTAPFSILFNAGYAASQNIYGLVQSYSGADSPWATLGTWTP